jgi:uncharacterized protein YndB with AHSA1/START domain
MSEQPSTEAKSICVDYELAQPPSRVWRALTEPDLLARWLMANDIRPVVGHRFTFQAPPMPGWDGIVRCEVLEVVPEKRLRYSWQGGAPESVLDSTVTWTLAETPSGGTRLSLEHAGFLPRNAFAYEAMGKGWRGKLAERVAKVLEEAA